MTSPHPNAAAPELDLPLYIGTYNRPGDWFTAHGRGLLTCRFNVRTGDIALQDAFTAISNPCYLARSREGGLLAAADHFMKPGAVHAFTPGADGALRHLSEADAQGQAVCHVCAGSPGVVYAVSYMDSRLTVHELSPEGALSEAVQLWRYTGSGPNLQRQTSAHPHQAVLAPDGRHLYVPDLGSDCVHVHAVRADGRLEPARDVPLAAGSGPRHLVFHPTRDLAYLVGELDGVVRVLERDRESGGLRQRASHPTTAAAQPSAAAIHLDPSGRILAVSERSDSTLCFFDVGADGALSFARRLAAGGTTPREFAFDPSGRWLVVGCQDSDLVAVHAIDPLTGLPTGIAREFSCGSPVCFQF
jgi:6-phosphogluconolactonase (cycloisomerase 2 family)